MNVMIRNPINFLPYFSRPSIVEAPVMLANEITHLVPMIQTELDFGLGGLCGIISYTIFFSVFSLSFK